MPKSKRARTPANPIHARIEDIVRSAADQLRDVVREEIAAQVMAIVGTIRSGRQSLAGRIETAARGALGSSTSGRATATSRAPRAGGRPRRKRRNPPHCINEGCKKPHQGPRSGYFCAEHRELPKKDKDKARARWQEQLKRR